MKPGQFRIQIIRTVGEGGLGVVEETRVTESTCDYPIGMRLARKRLLPQWARQAPAQARFEREIEMMATMNHPNIVPLRGVSLPGEERAYFMPYYPDNLRKALAEGRYSSSPVNVARFFEIIADALAYAHGFGFVHRDLKPENILLDGGIPMVADWGLGQFIHKHSKVLRLTHGGPMGTDYYCSLEQWSTGNGGTVSDVYSLGVMVAEMIARRPIPIAPQGFGIQQDILPGLDAASRNINRIVRRMTHVVPNGRLQSMVEVASFLRRVSISSAA